MKTLLQKAFVALIPLAFFALFFFLAVLGLGFSFPAKKIGVPIIGMHFLVLSALGLLKPVRIQGRSARVLFLWCFAVVAVFPFAFMSDAFGVGDFSSLLITMSENRATELFSVGVEGFTSNFWDLLAKMAGLLVLGFFMIKYVVLGQGTVLLLSLLFVVGNPVTLYLYKSVVPHPAQSILKDDIQSLNPKILKTPSSQKNLVIIYLESLERTYAELDVTKEAFSQLAEFEKSGLAFSNLQQLPSTFFTAGGIVASQCGVPLLPRGVFNMRLRINDKIDVVPEEEDFLIELNCIGDLLTEQGYNASYINGSPLSIYSKGAFFRSHGFQTVKGLESYPNYETEPRTNIWGMDDDLLFERLTDELKRLAEDGRPFILSTLTLATHGPNGYLDSDCEPQEQDHVPFVAAIRCSGKHISRLMDDIDSLGLTDKTLVVLLSDHLAYKNALRSELETLSDARTNFGVILGGETEVISRPGSLMDVYPTILEMLGYELDAHRAGLGRSLIGEAPTLIEAHGVDRVNLAINENSDLQRAIWAGEASN